MSYEGQSEGLDYYPCHYDGSPLTFRGPAVPLDAAYTVVIGGCEVYGRYVEDPFTDQLAEMTGRRVVNLGVRNAGLDVFTLDERLLRLVSRAEVVVIQLTGAHNISNRFYTVHPRRNDRFLKAARPLTSLYRDIDFSDFSFTRHMLVTLRRKCPKRFKRVQEELAQAWQARMKVLLNRISGTRILLHVETGNDHGLGPEPAFISRGMISELDGVYDQMVHCAVSTDRGEDRLREMVFPETERAAAMRLLSVKDHEQIAVALAEAVRRSDGMAA